MMDKKTPQFTTDQILIKAAPETVWKVLTDPELTPQYMFGCTVQCDWKKGAPILWTGVQDGVTYVKGNLKVFDEPATLSFTVFDPNAAYPDIPENYLTATYSLSQQQNGTMLKVTQGDYAMVADGNKRYRDSVDSGGWMPVLEGIRKISESLS